jgi:hypothetical protein
MPRQPHEFVQIKLRLAEPLRRELEREAKKHRFTLNNEIRLRLEDSFNKYEVPRALTDLIHDLKLNWDRYSNRFVMLTLEDQLADALSRTKDPEVANLARVWLLHRNIDRRLSEEGRVS